MLEFENSYIEKGYKLIAGVDEAGRGPLAGPVACACVIMPLGENDIIEGVNDSKKLSEKKRDELYIKILEKAITVNCELIDSNKIDEINILNATKLGMQKAVNNLSVKPDVVLVDAVNITGVEPEVKSIFKGDMLSYSIACASIVAKVTRDLLMKQMHIKHPEYGFDKHKGYGTKMHIENIKKHGICDIHRRSFVKKYYKN